MNYIDKRREVLTGTVSKLIDDKDVHEFVILLTPQCNMNCKYCYEAPLWKDKDKVDVNLNGIVAAINDHSPKVITFLGGDTFNKTLEFRFLLSKYPEIEFRLFNDIKRYDEIEQYLEEFPNLKIDISIDPTWKTRFNSEKEWLFHLEKAKAIIEKFLPRITINMVITSAGYDWNILREHLGEEVRLYIKPVALEDNAELEPTGAQRKAIETLFVKEFDRKENGLSYIAQVDKYISQASGDKMNFRCSCGIRRLTVDWLGRISFCDALPLSYAWEEKYIDKEYIVEALASAPQLCLDCEYLEQCGGPCVILEPPNEFYCWWQKTFLKVSGLYSKFKTGV